MAAIVPKLNLNKTPHLADNNSLIFAKNIRLDTDGNIHKDYGISSLLTNFEVSGGTTYKRIYSEIAYRLLSDIDNYVNDLVTEGQPIPDIYNPWTTDVSKDSYYTILRYIIDEEFLRTRRQAYFIEKDFSIVGVIPDNNAFYLFCVGFITYADITNNNSNESVVASGSYRVSFIVKYDEDATKYKFSICDCNWNYSGGVIDGCVVTNLIGDTILNIGETKEDGTLIPFKCINLNKSSYTDDESVYTQIPNIPITNLNFNGTFDYVIPNGTYQFFIRYKVREDFYTDWFPASRELFAANKENEITNFGTVSKVNTHKDSNYSFIFDVDTLFSEYTQLYKSFQIGFILAHDDAIYGRAWKHFDFDTSIVKFDYNANDATDVEITDFTKPTYGIYNVKNVASFKNKLYIANYTESNFNENLQDIANNITITIGQKQSGSGYGEYEVTTTPVGGKTYIDGIKIPSSAKAAPQTVIKHFYGNTGIVHELMNISVNSTTMETVVTNSVRTDKMPIILESSIYGFTARLSKESLEDIQQRITNNITSQDNYYGGVAGSGPVFSRNVVSIEVDNVVCNDISTALTKIYDTIYYLNYNGEFINKNNIPQNTIKVKIYRSYTWKYYTDDPIDEGNTHLVVRAIYNNVNRGESYRRTIHDGYGEYVQEIRIIFRANSNLINEANINPFKHYTTLIPYQKYKFYIHFVKQTGEITNGYYCNGSNAGEIEIPYQPHADRLLYPIFSNISIPDNYVACFFSIFHSAVYSASVFLNANGSLIEGRCFDVNARLLPFTSLINCRQEAIVGNNDVQNNVKGTYHYSSDSSEGRYFGADGIISFDADNNGGNQSGTEYSTLIDNFNDSNPNLLYALTDYQSQQDIDVELVKCTPFIKKQSQTILYDNYIDLNLLGYLCTLPPLHTYRVTTYFSDGSNAYLKDIAGSSTHNIHLKELGKYTDSNPGISGFPIIASENVNVYSNFNIQYFTVIEDPIPKVATYYNKASTDATDYEANAIATYWKLLKSLILADLYTLPSMYKDYTRKVYSTYNEKAIIKFDNTIRSSVLIDDEAEISIFRFNPDDYYNVPTNRGIIINLASIGDAILVHTQDSMFRFSGHNTLSGSTGEITTQETDVFDTGVAEIFGSDFGFAGLQNKNDAIITQNGYIFFDRDAKIIYMYGGQNQITKLSDSIEKLFNYSNISNIAFANDFYNNRFFVCVVFTNSKSVTLSFNFLNNSKSFISLHDFKFDYAFNTKTNCYFLDAYKRDICYIDKTIFGIYDVLGNLTDSVYPYRNNNHTEQVYYDNGNTLITFTHKLHASILDVIYNVNYELVKTLNNIEWCGSIINKIFRDVNNSDITTLMVAEPTQENHPCTYIRIYSDTCLTDLISCTQRANDNRLDRSTSIPIKSEIRNQLDSYKYPRYNQGKWALNYFRNILNANDLDGSNEDYDNGRNNDTPLVDNRYKYISDQNSLVEGKYFVVRFIFDDNADFRLESLTINDTNKL